MPRASDWKLFNKAPDKVEPKPSDLQESAEYLKDLEGVGIHSMHSLRASRMYSVKLVNFLTGTYRENAVKELLDQEKKLQESIRLLDFSDGENFLKLRRTAGIWFIVLGFALSILAWLLAAFKALPLETLTPLLDYTKWLLSGTILTLAGFLFTNKKK